MVAILHTNQASTSTSNGSSKLKRQWNVKASPAAARSNNLIRSVVSGLGGTSTTSSKPLINLGLGDPTAYGLNDPSPEAVAAVRDCVIGGKANGYLPGQGVKEALDAVAEYHTRWDGVQYEGKDVTLCHGATHALDLAFNVLISPGQNVIFPRPGFPSYQTLLGTLNCEIRYYDCLVERGWECDLEEMERQIDENTAFILVNNPSNPMGINFPASHLRKIISIASNHRVPIIADEIYGHMVWGEGERGEFVPMAGLNDGVPIITVGGLSKRFLVPGWRTGWLIMSDPQNHAQSIREGLHIFANRILGPNTLIQKALPGILKGTDGDWFKGVLKKLEMNANTCYKTLSQVPGLYCTKPNAAMYLLLGIDMDRFPAFKDDVEFAKALVIEQNIFLIPGSAFLAPCHVRLVTASPPDVMRDACERIRDFCGKHHVAA